MARRGRRAEAPREATSMTNRAPLRLAGWSFAAALLLAQAGPALAAPAPPNCGGCFALVQTSAALIASRGVLQSVRLATGQIKIAFKRPINLCAVSVTLDSLQANVGLIPSIAPLVQRISN